MLGRKILFARFLTFPIVLLMASCGAHQENTLNSDKTPKVKPLFVLLGGNQSCGSDDQGRHSSPFATGLFQKFVQHFLGGDINGDQWDYLVSCHRGDETVFYAESSDPGQVREADLEEFLDIFSPKLSAHPLTFLTGHSYGGWLAMHMSLRVSLASPSHNIPGFYTIDAISRRNCRFTWPAECQNAPSDFSRDERLKMADMSGTWLNFYQTRTWYLHSSSIAEADANHEIDASHTAIEDEDEVWGAISQSMREKWLEALASLEK